MRLVIFLLLISTTATANIIRDTVPTGVPQLFGAKYYKFKGYVLMDSAIMTIAADTNFIPYFPSLKFKISDSSWYGYDLTGWRRLYHVGDILANNGLTESSDTVQLGQPEGAAGDPAVLLNPRQIPLNGNNIRFSGDTGNIILGDTTENMDWRRIGRMQINSNDTTHPLLTIGPSPADNVFSIFSDNKAQLVIGLVDTPRHNQSQQNLKTAGLIARHKSYFPDRTSERLGSTRYVIQADKSYYARDTVDFQSGNPGGDLIGAFEGEHGYRQFPGYAGRTIYISDSSFGSEPHVGNANSVFTSSLRTRNNLVAGDMVYLKGWYANYNTQLLMTNPDTIENYIHYLAGQNVIGGGSGTYNISKQYQFFASFRANGPNSEVWGFYDYKHPAVSGNYRYNWFGHKTGVGPGRERPAYILDVDGSFALEKDSTPIITSIGSNYLLTIDTSANPGDSNRIKRILPTDLGLTGANTALSNLASVAINTSLVSDAYNIDALGSSALAWSDLFLGNGSVIEWSSAASTPDITLTHSSNLLTLAGGNITVAGLSRLQSGSLTGSLILGADQSATTITDATTKQGRIVVPHYNTAQSNVFVFGASAGATTNNLVFGGSSGSLNAATNIDFYTAATNTTAAGSPRLSIISDGKVGIGVTNPSVILHVLNTSEQLRLGYDASNYFSATIASNGSATLNLTGTSPEFTFSDAVNFQSAVTTNGTVTMNNNPTGLTSDRILVKGADSVVKTIAAPLNGSATLDFGNTAAGTSSDLTITVTGAADGDVVSLGVPNGSTLSNGCFTTWVSASNTVTVRFTNNDLLTSLDPASGTFKVTVFK